MIPHLKVLWSSLCSFWRRGCQKWAVRELTYLPNWGACLLTDGIAEQWQLWFDSWHHIAKISCKLCKVQTQGFHLLVPICIPKCAACCEQKPDSLPPTQDILWLLPTNVSMSSMHYSCFPPIKKPWLHYPMISKGCYWPLKDVVPWPRSWILAAFISSPAHCRDIIY